MKRAVSLVLLVLLLIPLSACGKSEEEQFLEDALDAYIKSITIKRSPDEAEAFRWAEKLYNIDNEKYAELFYETTSNFYLLASQAVASVHGFASPYAEGAHSALTTGLFLNSPKNDGKLDIVRFWDFFPVVSTNPGLELPIVRVVSRIAETTEKPLGLHSLVMASSTGSITLGEPCGRIVVQSPDNRSFQYETITKTLDGEEILLFRQVLGGEGVSISFVCEEYTCTEELTEKHVTFYRNMFKWYDMLLEGRHLIPAEIRYAFE